MNHLNPTIRYLLAYPGRLAHDILFLSAGVPSKLLSCRGYRGKPQLGNLYIPAKLTAGGPQNDGLEKVDSFKIWPILVSIYVKFLGCKPFLVHIAPQLLSYLLPDHILGLHIMFAHEIRTSRSLQEFLARYPAKWKLEGYVPSFSADFTMKKRNNILTKHCLANLTDPVRSVTHI